MIPLNPDVKTLITKPKPLRRIDTKLEDGTGINVGLNFEDRFVVIELDQPESNTSSILTLPIDTAHTMALQVLEATTIINFANSIGLQLKGDENE